MTVTMETVYISGPISGYDLEERRAAFARAADAVRGTGRMAVTPFDVSPNAEADYATHMGNDIRALLRCDRVCFLPGWQLSKGCMLEFAAAKIYGKWIMFYGDEKLITSIII